MSSEKRDNTGDQDDINHPKHYTSHPSGVECIEVVEHLSFNVGNAIKYLWRCGLKVSPTATTIAEMKEDELKDLQKAKWYIEREIDLKTRQQQKS